MADNRRYWTDKGKRMAQAKKHVDILQKYYGKEIEEQSENTKMYSPYSFTESFVPKYGHPEQVFVNTDSVSAILQEAKENSGKRIAVLNFASYKNPGGMFLQGSKAQEECLCMESTLYPVLEKWTDLYYIPNRNNLNRALYTDRALYTENVLFARKKGELVKADVLTCAAPNFSAAAKYGKVSEIENSKILEDRIRFVRNILQEKADIIILGAWGCGVFGQDPKEVASLFENAFHDFPCDKVVYAVPGNDETADIFRQRFEN